MSKSIKTKDLPKRPNDEDGHDSQLEYVAAKQGFDGPAQTISEKDLAKMDNPIVLYRGIAPYTNSEGRLISGAELQQEFISGKYFAGLGGAGNGTYWADGEEYAKFYADDPNSVVIKAVLDPSANISQDAPQYTTTKAASSTLLAMKGFDGTVGYPTASSKIYITFNRTAIQVVTK